MFDYLVDHALKNVWCTPDQDMQAIVKPARLTTSSGAFSSVTVQWRKIDLPVRGARFHVFQIGQLHPLLMGLFPVSNEWMTLAQACNLQNLIADVYSVKGIELPRCEVWYMVTADKNLILAVKNQDRVPVDLYNEDIYFRVYSNAYFNSVRANAATDVVVVNGKNVKTQADILTLQNEFNTYKTKPGLVYAFINGYKVSGIDLFTARIGDMVEYVYDPSIKKVLNFRIGDLPSFNSVLDNKHKYLLHYADTDVNTIDFQDDLDLFLSRQDSNGRSSGVYYHRNAVDAVRMVTHRDYAVPVAYVAAYVESQPLWTDIDNLVLTVHVRKSGYERALVNEHSRIKELYKLSDSDVVSAMVGLNAVVPFWTAAALENSDYVRLMGERAVNVTGELVQQAYGYNAVSKLLFNTPTATHMYSGYKVIDVPYGLQSHCTAYEYDSAGVLLGVFSHSQGSTYICRDIRAQLVEMIEGEGYDKLDEYYGLHTQTLDPTLNYRMYICSIEAGVVTNDWIDVTGSAQYSVIGNTLTWLVDESKYYTLVRSDKVFLDYDLQLMMTDGLLKFSLNHRQTRHSVTSNYVMQIPMGELDLFLNGQSLIEGIDYIVNFPEIVIINKKYLVNPKTTKQKIHIRFTGFCNENLEREPIGDRGFVDYGLISHNGHFDIRDDKVIRIVVDGKLKDRSQLLFAEESTGVTLPNSSNGLPYMVRDIVTPLRGMTHSGTYALRALSQAVDKQVSDYLSLKKPQPTHDTPSAIAALYQVVSPFACKLLYDLEAGVLDDPRLKQHYSDEVVMELCEPYLPLLKYDPTQTSTQADFNYTVVHCHPLNEVLAIDIYTYKFLTMVNRVYLKGKVEMSHITQLKPVA